jgi:short subunit dehydrogenase-like uncharacterized protein
MAANRTVAVFGAYGHTGRFVVTELLRRGFRPILSGRGAEKLRALADDVGGEARVASVDDPGSLDRAFAGAAAVIHCAGPFLDTSRAVLEAALRGGIHYLDVAAEQPPVIEAFERFDRPAREAGIVVMPAMAFYGGMGDLLATAARGDWTTVDDVSLGIALDSWHPTRGTRITGERNSGARFAVAQGRLQPLGTVARTRSWDFPSPFFTQEVVPLGLADVILMHRHLNAAAIVGYLNAAPLADLDDPATPAPTPADASGRSAQLFLLDVRVARGGETRRLVARGRDIYAITAPLVVEAVERILSGRCTGVGTRTAGQAFDARDFLRALAPAGLEVEPG